MGQYHNPTETRARQEDGRKDSNVGSHPQRQHLRNHHYDLLVTIDPVTVEKSPSYNVGDVKYFLSILTRALLEVHGAVRSKIT